MWPFICGFYVAACVAAGQMDLAERKLLALTELVKPWHENAAEWQTWSAAMYLYAVQCVQQKRTPFFDLMRTGDLSTPSEFAPK